MKEVKAPKQSFLPQKLCDYYIKIVIIPKAFNTNMQQNGNKICHYENMTQRNVSKTSIQFVIDIEQYHPKFELKPLNLIAQIPFTKDEKTHKNKLTQSLLQLKATLQASKTRQNQLAKQKPQKMELPSLKLQVFKKHSLNQQKKAHKQNEKVKKTKKHINSQRNNELSQVGQELQRSSKQLQKLSKKQLKQLKKAQKQKQKQPYHKLHCLSENISSNPEQKQQISHQLLQIFQQKYSYYLNNKKIIFPIEDSLLQLYHQLASQNQTNSNINISRLQRKLSTNFCKQLQIWNMLIQHPSFFNVSNQIAIEQIPALIRQENNLGNRALFRNLHQFYINDIIIHKYDQSVDQQYFSFISLWRYADQNNFLQKIFRTNWNKLILFYISIQKNHYHNYQINEELQAYEDILKKDVNNGKFTIFARYDEMINYLIFLINMCFETITFKTLINNKMLFFRDNNKIKNQLLQQKKSIDNKLWQLKQNEKLLSKKQKINAKTVKKQTKLTLDPQSQQFKHKIALLQGQIEEINRQRQLILLKRQELNKNIIDIDNKIYELCCLPQFSNVWLLGEDRYFNSYWFIRDCQNAIYRQCKNTGQWGIIQHKNIQLLYNTLNRKGIRQRKLSQKILYYKQLGYIKFNDGDGYQKQQKQQVKSSQQSQMKQQQIQSQENITFCYDIGQFQKFSYGQYMKVTPYIIKTMILKSQWMMSKYLFQRNSKWTNEEARQQYINTILHHDFKNIDDLTQQLRLFNEKICVVEINIKIANQNEGIDLKTRKIQTKIWGINEKYKHFWYDYSKKCKDISDLHFLISILYLTIQRYVTKTRKPTNTKYFFKTVQLGENVQNTQNNEHYNEDDMLFS